MKTLQLLSHSKRDKEGKVYKYYSIAEPYWDKKTRKNEKNVVLYRGSLPDEKADSIRRFLKLMNAEKDIIVTTVEDIIFNEHWRYLDVAFLDCLWEQWGLSTIFPYSEDKDVQTSEIAKILTIYRCLDPSSYLSAVGWFKKTALNLILNIDESKINKSRIFRELSEIEDVKRDIEKYLYKFLKELDKHGFRIVFYDVTDSYFEGRNCELANSGITKSNGFRKKKIVLALLVNSKGYPFAWDVIEDYTADVKTIKSLSIQWKMQFNFGDNEIILIFDRGMVSDENLKHLEGQKQLYLTALDKNQIPGINVYLFSLNQEYKQYIKKGPVSDALRKIFDDNKLPLHDKAKIIQKEGEPWMIQSNGETYLIKEEDAQVRIYGNIDLKPFTLLDESNMINEVIKMGFSKHDDKTYYKELTVFGSRRHVLVFNQEMFLGERKSREELIQRARDYLEKEDNALSKAEKSRSESVTRNKIDEKLKNMKTKTFVDYDLKPIVINMDGKKINSFHIILKETSDTEEAIKNAKRTDGLWNIITSVKNKEGDNNGLTAGELISAYRDKNQIEQAFKDVKSFIKIHPFNVWEPKHVRAHYTLCVLSYLLDVTIANRLREANLDIKSPQKVYEILRRGIIGEMCAYDGGKEMLKLVRPKAEETQILNLFENKHIIEKKHLELMNIYT